MALILVFYLGGWLYWTVTTPLAVAGQPPATVAAYPGNRGHPPLLVSAAWLKKQRSALGDRLVIVDLSSIRRYEREHIPDVVWCTGGGRMRWIRMPRPTAAWKGAGGPLTSTWTAPRTGASSAPERIAPGTIVSMETLRARFNDPDTVILDTRTRDEATDGLNGTIRTGRIPGAIWLPWNETTLDTAG